MLNRHTLPPNTFLDGSYRIERVVGSGGFGITYEATDVNLGTLVAIKEYFPHDFGDRDNTMSVRPRSEHSKHLFEWGRTNFLHEARTLAGFDHPSIVRVLRVFEAHSTAYMVMRYERGKSVSTWLKELGRKPTQEELDAITAPLLDALEVLHKANYLHRDIAPDNIIVRPDGSPVLLDFGSARRVIAEMSRMVTGIVKAGYSPHEQYAADNRLQGPWTDIYALGATLYRAVTQRQPVESMLRFDTDTMETAAALGGAGYRASFLAAIDACLKVRPSERPQSVTELRRMLQPPPLLPSPPTTVISTPSVLATTVRRQLSAAREATQKIVEKTRVAAGETVQTLRFDRLGAWLIGSALVVLLLAGSFAIFQSLKGPTVTVSSAVEAATSQSTMTTSELPSGGDAFRQRQGDDPARILAEREAQRRLAELEAQRRQEAERQRLALLDDQRRQREAAEAERKRLAELDEQKRQEAERQRLAALEEQRRQQAEREEQRRRDEAERKRLADLEVQRRKDEEERRQRALQEEQQRKAQAELERRQQAEREEQRRRDEAERKRLADLEEKRLKAEAEARRLEAEQQRLAAIPSSEQLGLYVGRIEEVLKKAACFQGLREGVADDVQTGLTRYSEGLRKYGLQKPAPIQVASATTGAIETWLKEAGEVRVNACAAPAVRPQVQQRPQHVAPQRPAQRPSSSPRGPGTITGIQ